jgi:hypothetical protein
MDLSTTCAGCGKRAALIEILAPGELPADFESRDQEARDKFLADTDPASWRLRYTGPGGGNGDRGTPITQERAEAFIEVFTEPYSIQLLPKLKMYDRGSLCPECRKPYCYWCWNTSVNGWGYCPQGHSHGIDPYYGD